MGSIDDEKMIQAFFPDSADPAFGEGVGIGSPDRSVDDLQAFRFENGIECLAETAVIVMDQEPQGLFSIGKFPNQLSGLLSNPKLIRVSRDTGKMDTPRTQFDEEEHIEDARPVLAGIPDTVAVVTSDWKEFGKLPVVEWGKFGWQPNIYEHFQPVHITKIAP